MRGLQIALILSAGFAAAQVPPPVIVSLTTEQVQVVIDAAGPGDQYFSPAGTCTTGGTCRTTSAAMGDPPMNTQRFGYNGTPFTYAVPLPNGTYDVALDFAEAVQTLPGRRVFTVTVQGETSAPIDLVKLTGGPNFPYSQRWAAVPVRAGLLTIRFAPVLASNGQPIGNPVVNAISINTTPPAGVTATITCPSGVNLTVMQGAITAALCSAPCPGYALCAFVYHEIPAGTIDGVNTTFILKTVPYPNSAQVWVGGGAVDPVTLAPILVMLSPSAWAISGSTITLQQPVPLTGSIVVDYRA